MRNHLPIRIAQIRNSICLFSMAGLVFAAMLSGPLKAMGQESPELSGDQIRQAAQGVMEHNDFRRLRENDNSADEGFLSKLLKRFDQDTATQDPGDANMGTGGGFANAIAGGVGQLFMVIALLVVAALIGFIIVLIVRSIDKNERMSKKAGPPSPIELESVTSTPPGEFPSEQYRIQAEKYAQAGDYRGAIRQLLLGSMSWIERMGMIHFRRGLTNRDYWRAVFRQETCREAFAAIAFEFEKVFFGRRQATVEMYQSCLNQFLKEFHEQRAVATN